MLDIDKDTMIRVLSEHDGVALVSLGKPRDAFELPRDVPHWTSGFGGKYEMVHTNVPAGVMIGAGDLEGLTGDFDELKAKLSKLDIYPMGHSGDFKEQPLTALKKWFFDRSVRNDEVNHQWPIKHTAHQLTKARVDEHYGPGKYEALVAYLANEMHIFRDPKNSETLIPTNALERAEIVRSLLDGVSKAVRYTRLDHPATAYQFTLALNITKPGAGTLSYLLEEGNKIVVLRVDPNTGETSLTPLDRAMIGKTYDTADGKPLGDRGQVDMLEILRRVKELDTEEKAGPKFIKKIVQEGPQRVGGATQL